jgi:hypothetical protein
MHRVASIRTLFKLLCRACRCVVVRTPGVLSVSMHFCPATPSPGVSLVQEERLEAAGAAADLVANDRGSLTKVAPDFQVRVAHVLCASCPHARVALTVTSDPRWCRFHRLRPSQSPRLPLRSVHSRRQWSVQPRYARALCICSRVWPSHLTVVVSVRRRSQLLQVAAAAEKAVLQLLPPIETVQIDVMKRTIDVMHLSPLRPTRIAHSKASQR